MFVWNAQTSVSTASRVTGPNVAAISPDGTRVGAYNSSFKSFSLADATTQTNYAFTSGVLAHAGAQFNADGRYLAYVLSVPTSYNLGPNQIYVYDFQTGSNTLVSASFTARVAASANSDSPAISPDGHLVAYRSFATNLTPGGGNGLPNVFVYDQTTGATRLASVSQFGNASANSRSLMPVFSGDSQTLFFQSWASDLLGGFLSSSGEIWALGLYSTNAPPAFTTAIGPGIVSGQRTILLWPVNLGIPYQAQFKNELSDPVWQPLTSGFTILGNQGYFLDPAPPTGHRFYRIISF